MDGDHEDPHTLKMCDARVGLDSQCLSYLLDALAGVDEPTDRLAEERKALIRIWFYTAGTFDVSETVVSECAAIGAPDRRALHEQLIQFRLQEGSVRDPVAVEKRIVSLRQSHATPNDCRVLAEAEDLELCALLTYDRDFRRRLSPMSDVSLMMPSVYWNQLGIPRGALPPQTPHPTNPLSTQFWWRWE